MLYHQGKLEEAAELYKKSLAISIKTLGEQHPSVATTYGNLAGVCAVECMCSLGSERGLLLVIMLSRVLRVWSGVRPSSSLC